MAYCISGLPEDEIQKAVQEKFGDSPEKLSYSEQVGRIVGEYTRQNPPKPNMTAKERRNYRRAARRAISERAKNEVKPVGSIMGGFLLMTIIGSIISFFIQMFLRKHFERQGITMDMDEFDVDETDENL